MTGAQGEQNTLHLGAARWRPESRYSVGEVGREKWGKREVMLGWRSQPASFSSPSIKLNPPWSPHQSWWLLLAPEKRMMAWKGRREFEREAEKRVGVEDNGCLFISHTELRSSNQGRSAVAMHPWIFWFLRETFTAEDLYYSQSNLTLKSHQNINNYVKYQLAGSLTRSLTIHIKAIHREPDTCFTNCHHKSSLLISQMAVWVNWICLHFKVSPMPDRSLYYCL